MVVIEEGINDIIARSDWPQESEGVRFLAPKVRFRGDKIVIMGPVVFKGFEVIVTIVGEASITEEGLLRLKVSKVKMGAITITPLARRIAENIYEKEAGRNNTVDKDLEGKIAAALLADKPFEPVFEINKKKIRAKKIIIENKKLTVHMVPAGG